jgi:hypothetical protein
MQASVFNAPELNISKGGRLVIPLAGKTLAA